MKSYSQYPSRVPKMGAKIKIKLIMIYLNGHSAGRLKGKKKLKWKTKKSSWKPPFSIGGASQTCKEDRPLRLINTPKKRGMMHVPDSWPFISHLHIWIASSSHFGAMHEVQNHNIYFTILPKMKRKTIQTTVDSVCERQVKKLSIGRVLFALCLCIKVDKASASQLSD